MEHSGVWIFAEQQYGRIQKISYELLSRGLELAEKRRCELSTMIFGHDINSNDLEELIERGSDRVVVIQAPELEHFLIEPYAACTLEIIKRYYPEIIIAGATSTGRTLMPYVAIKTYTGLTADCTGLDIEQKTNNLLQIRPAIGGNIMATIKTPKLRPQIATVRPHSTKPAPKQTGREGQIIQLKKPKGCSNSRIVRLNFTANKEEKAVQNADIVVVAGRGIKRKENISLIRELADALGATLGATREVVDRGWLSYRHQVGLSGKTISPKLYIGVGVSGAIQHLAGMQTSDTIVAINNDVDAQIFKVTDFGIVGDLFNIVPALTKQIKGRMTHEK